jgi:Zn-dependent M28 family amino/carboxypeptidase
MQAMQAFAQKRAQFFIDEGAAVLVYAGRGEEGTVWPTGNGSRDPKAPKSLPTITMAIEHYGRIFRTLEKNIPVTLTVDMKNRFYDNDLNSFNILGEIPGSDKKDEVVMLGAHFDSWHSGTGATDNAAGSAVMMEALRILKTLNLPLRRTVRIGLWTGEEQGLIGSREYVKAHFGDRQTMQLTPAHAKFSSYYNVDNGTGQIRGVYLQENAAVAPIFKAWLEPFADWGASTITIRNTGGTDHQAFDAVGLPGFQFIQDPIHYDTRTHHTNMDTYERIQAQDMMRNAVIVAAFVYQAANREELIPRKTPPTPVGGR